MAWGGGLAVFGALFITVTVGIAFVYLLDMFVYFWIEPRLAFIMLSVVIRVRFIINWIAVHVLSNTTIWW